MKISRGALRVTRRICRAGGCAVLLALTSAASYAASNPDDFIIYSDAGIPAAPADLFTWHDSSCSPTFNGKFSDPTAPEGKQCFQTAAPGCAWAGWGVFKHLDMREFSSGEIRFYLKSTVSLRFELEGPQNTKAGVVVPSTGGRWQEQVYPISSFAGMVDLSQMYGLFLMSSTDGPATFYVDNVRWIKAQPSVAGLVVRTNGLCPTAAEQALQLQVNQTYSITAGRYLGYVFRNWTDGAGNVLSAHRKVSFVMQSNLVLVANYSDVMKPTLRITAPISGSRLTNATVKVQGSIKENGCIGQVLCQLNGGQWQQASAATNWSATVSLTPGLNTVRAYAVDAAGNISRTNSVKFTYVLTAPVVVGISGQGAVGPNYNGRWLEIGKTYKMRAAPAARYRFVGWTGSLTNASTTLTFVMASHLTFTANFEPAKRVLSGIDFSPYEDGQDPNLGAEVPVEQLRERMARLRSYTSWVRTYGCTRGLEKAGQVAHGLQLKAAIGAWLGSDTNANETEIANLVQAAKQGDVDLAIVGSETLLRGDLTEDQLFRYLGRVKQELPNMSVATADGYEQWLSHPRLIAAVDLVLVNYYPFWAGTAISNAIPTLNGWHRRLTKVAGVKPVVVSETGWPSAGDSVGNAVPSAKNAHYYFLDFVSWAEANQVPYFYFAAFDENWKIASEGSVGAHWGLWDTKGRLKAGSALAFDSKPLPDSWTGRGIPGGPGTPALEFTKVPAYGSHANLEGQVLHVEWTDYAVVVYIYVNGWWVKPTFANPLTPIEIDGRWVCDVTTGGVDEFATAYAAFVVPIDYSPPLLGGSGSLPSDLDTNAVAKVIAARNP
jgi:uncharacterized repeat protein (TIGR02543 family)